MFGVLIEEDDVLNIGSHVFELVQVFGPDARFEIARTVRRLVNPLDPPGVALFFVELKEILQVAQALDGRIIEDAKSLDYQNFGVAVFELRKSHSLQIVFVRARLEAVRFFGETVQRLLVRFLASFDGRLHVTQHLVHVQAGQDVEVNVVQFRHPGVARIGHVQEIVVLRYYPTLRHHLAQFHRQRGLSAARYATDPNHQDIRHSLKESGVLTYPGWPIF